MDIKGYYKIFNGNILIEKTIITILVHFNLFEIEAKIKGGKLVGFKEIKIIKWISYIFNYNMEIYLKMIKNLSIF